MTTKNIENLFQSIRDFRHQYQRYFVFSVPSAKSKCVDALTAIILYAGLVKKEFKLQTKLLSDPKIISDLDELLRIVKEEENNGR
jgi:hypothetical protein